jgi:hypothetical protein
MPAAKSKTNTLTTALTVHEREAIKAVVNTAVALLAQDNVHVALPPAAHSQIEAAFADHIQRG